MKFADRLKFTASGTSAATITFGAAVAGFRTLAQAISDGGSDPLAIKVGDTGLPFSIDDGAGNVELSLFTVTSATVLTRTSVLSSSAGGSAVAFTGSSLTVFSSMPASFARSLPTVSTDSSGGFLSFLDPKGNPISGSVEQLAGLPMIVFGNSYDGADTNNTPGTRSVIQLAAKLRMTITNNAVSGSMMQDYAIKAIGTVAPISVAYNGIVWIGNGINDAARNNPDPNTAAPQAGYKASLESLIYRSCAATIVQETDASFVYSGTWTAATLANYGSGALKKTSTQGDSVTITTPAGTDFTLLLWSVYNVTQGDATITLDGQPFTVLSNPQCGTSPGTGAVVAPYMIAFTGLSNATHTIVVTKTDATTNTIYVDDLYVLKNNPPLILAEKTCQVQAAGYTLEGGKGSDATVAVYNTLFDGVISKVRAAYPKVRIAVSDPQANGWIKATMIGSADGLHPNDYGEYFRRFVAENSIRMALNSLGWVAGINKI